jgi:hypothetical protein
MRFGRFLSCFLGLSLGSAPLHGQDVNMARPTEMSVQHRATPEEIRDRAAKAQFQKDVKELSDLCASVPHDMDGLKQGVLSKDSIDKLKRMEKLSKHIREELTRN